MQFIDGNLTPKKRMERLREQKPQNAYLINYKGYFYNYKLATPFLINSYVWLIVFSAFRRVLIRELWRPLILLLALVGIVVKVWLSCTLPVCVCLSVHHDYLTIHFSVCPSIYLSLYLSLYLSVYPCIYLSICLSICLSMYLSIHLSLHLSIYLSIHLSVNIHLSTCVFVCLFISSSLSISLSIFLSICLYLSASIYLSVCLSISLSLSIYLLIFLSVYLCIYLSIYLCLSVYIYPSICHLSIYAAWQQHDVQELCRVMFDALEKRFKRDQHRQGNAQVRNKTAPPL